MMEIVHDERECPLCEAIARIEELERDCTKLEEKIDSLQNELDEKFND